MYALMYYKIALLTECLTTYCTAIWVITTMYAIMCYQSALMTESLITYCTAIRALTTMYALMCYQITLSTECFITYFTAIRVITTMYASMSYQSALSTECLITHCTAIRVFTIKYITGRFAFSTVYVKLSIQSTLVKTQMLNIRIYNYRPLITFIPMFTSNKCVKICCMVSKLCAYWILCSIGIYIPRAYRWIKMTFPPAPILRLRYIVLIIYCRKLYKNWWSGISRMKHWGMSRTSITNCLQTRAVHRNRNAPCDYTRMWSQTYESYTWAFLDSEGAADSTPFDTIKVDKWHGLETQSSDRLAPCWVAESYSHAQRRHSVGDCGQGLFAEGHFITRQLWSLVAKGAIQGLGNGCYTLEYALSSSADNSHILYQIFSKRLSNMKQTAGWTLPTLIQNAMLNQYF
jgi:hypothetical protein